MVSFSKIAALTSTVVVGVAARPLRNNGAGEVNLTQSSPLGLGASNTIPKDGTRYDKLHAVVEATIGGEKKNLALIGDSACKVPPYVAPNYGTQCIHYEQDQSELTVQNVMRSHFAEPNGESYYLFKMAQNETKTVSFDINYKGSSCGTNASVYLVDMLSQNGNYCDASDNGGYHGEHCAEIDLTEGNSNAQQFTSHGCGSTTSECDKNGDHAKSAQYFSPHNTSCGGIDTSKSFNISVTFEMGSDSLTKLTQTITQETTDGTLSKVTNVLSSDNTRSKNIYESLVNRGMVFTIAFWSGNQIFMENDHCGTKDPSIYNMIDLKWTLDNFTIINSN